MNTFQARIGYARTSTIDQNPDAQVKALEAAGCGVVRTERKSGTTLEGRPELKTILDFIHPGETLVVTRIDRLARSLGDLQTIATHLKSKGIIYHSAQADGAHREPPAAFTPAAAAGHRRVRRSRLDADGSTAKAFRTAPFREPSPEGPVVGKRHGQLDGTDAPAAAPARCSVRHADHSVALGTIVYNSQIKGGVSGCHRAAGRYLLGNRKGLP